jgi:hypothetical protein
MKPSTQAKWVTYKEVPLWCCDFGGLGSDHSRLLAEIAAAQVVIDRQVENSLLIAVVLTDATLTPEIVAFFNTNARHPHRPIRKMAILGVSDFQRFWYRRIKHVSWPQKSKFFSDWEKAKEWLVTEGF